MVRKPELSVQQLLTLSSFQTTSGLINVMS